MNQADRHELYAAARMSNNNCDGSGPHTPGEVRVYPLGGHGNLILCLHCFAHENQYRFERATVDATTGRRMNPPRHDLWPQVDWDQAEIYEGSA